MAKFGTHLQKVLMLVVLFVTQPFATHAQNSSDSQTSQPSDVTSDPRFEEIWQKSQSLRDQPATGTAPISFSIGDVNYKVPRNYIIDMPNWSGGPQEGMVKIKATYPGFEPLSDKTRECLTQPKAYWPVGCTPIEFLISGHTRLSDEERFRNGLKHWKDQTPKRGPNGLELYVESTGATPIHKTEFYRKQTSYGTVFVMCIYEGSKVPVCSHSTKISENIGDFYFIDFDQLRNVEDIDNGIRRLIESFTVKGE